MKTTSVVSLSILILVSILCTGFTVRHIRSDAEKSLKVEEGIAIAANKQILGQEAALQNTQKLSQQAQEDREFKRFLGTQ